MPFRASWPETSGDHSGCSFGNDCCHAHCISQIDEHGAERDALGSFTFVRVLGNADRTERRQIRRVSVDPDFGRPTLLRDPKSFARRWGGQMRPTIEAIGGLMSPDVSAYARVFNPIRASSTSMPTRYQTWASVLGSSFVPTAPWNSMLSGVGTPTGQFEPESGTLESEAAETLAAVLSRFTTTPDRCFFAMWDGYAEFREFDDASTVLLPPDRRMFIFEGALSIGTAPAIPEISWRLPVRWWTEDDAWQVAGDIYAQSVLVGGSTSVIDAVTRQPDLEAYRIAAADGIEINDL